MGPEMVVSGSGFIAFEHKKTKTSNFGWATVCGEVSYALEVNWSFFARMAKGL